MDVVWMFLKAISIFLAGLAASSLASIFAFSCIITIPEVIRRIRISLDDHFSINGLDTFNFSSCKIYLKNKIFFKKYKVLEERHFPSNDIHTPTYTILYCKKYLTIYYIYIRENYYFKGTSKVYYRNNELLLPVGIGHKVPCYMIPEEEVVELLL